MIPTKILTLIFIVCYIIALIVYLLERKYVNAKTKRGFRLLPVLVIAFLIIFPICYLIDNELKEQQIEKEKFAQKMVSFIQKNWGEEYTLKALSSKKEIHGSYSSSYFLLSGSSSGEISGNEYIQFQRLYPHTGETVSTSLPRKMIRTIESDTISIPHITYAFKSKGVNYYKIERLIGKHNLTLDELKDRPDLIEENFGLMYITVYAKKDDLDQIIDLNTLN